MNYCEDHDVYATDEDVCNCFEDYFEDLRADYEMELWKERIRG